MAQAKAILHIDAAAAGELKIAKSQQRILNLDRTVLQFASLVDPICNSKHLYMI